MEHTAQAYEKTQFVGKEDRRVVDEGSDARKGVLDHLSLQDAHYRINDIERRMSSVEIKIDAMAEKNIVTLALVQDVVHRQGRLEMAMDTLAGFVRQNCALLEDVIAQRGVTSLKRQIVEVCVVMAVFLSCVLSAAVAFKVY